MRVDRPDRRRWPEIVEACIRRELQPGAAMPSAEEDLVDEGALDSMAWVSVLQAIETATHTPGLGDAMVDAPRTISAILAALEKSAPVIANERPARAIVEMIAAGSMAVVAGWGFATGAGHVMAAEVEREFHLPAKKITKGAGIESVARAAADEDECTLGARACEAAFAVAGADIGSVDCVIATSETLVGYPSLGARLHARLLANPQTAVLDVGGGCLGLVNAFVAAQSLIAAGAFRQILVATADVHSRVLIPGRVKGEFGALFGDGASAFLLRHGGSDGAENGYHLGPALLGCNPAAAAAIRVGLNKDLSVDLVFDGSSLSRAAVTRLKELIEDLELRSGASRQSAAAFATHQPNPRLLDQIARQLRVPAEKFPPVAKTHGNLGSSTCGVALSMALSQQAEKSGAERGPIFVAALGPGLLWGGLLLSAGALKKS